MRVSPCSFSIFSVLNFLSTILLTNLNLAASFPYLLVGAVAALIPLARYHREQDMSLIAQALSRPSKAYAALHAVANWPHPSFLPHLLSLFDSNLKSTGRDDLLEAFYSALMAYDDQATYDVIDQILSHLEGRMLERNSKAFKSVLKEQERPRYMPIWEKHRIRIALMTKVPG